MFEVQCFIFENTPDPMWAALLSGFGVFIGVTMFLTPAGERYLEESHAEPE
jgi:hypothetical protein